MPPPILIVDDETTLARNIATFLERHGYDVRRVETAEDGLVELDALQSAVVLLDFNLPGMDGLEMLAEVRRRDRRTKVILMTGQGNERVVIEAMKAGAHDYLTKPLVLAELKKVLEKSFDPEQPEE